MTRRLALTAWLTTRMLAWRLVLPVLKRVVPLPRLVRLMGRRHAAGPAPGAAPDAVLRTARRMYRPRVARADNCLERSLLTYRFLLQAGIRPELVCGVDRSEEGVVGHAWVTVDGRPVSDAPDAVARFAPLVTFGPAGRR